MYFKRIDIQGFKSFAEPVSIEFHSGITCIVGPNGSGKSNISDAIRWVLGEQSAKMLRGGRMEEVIFSGTESRKSRGMAEVTLVIDNNSNILPIDYSEVAITRRMYRSGESGYFINKVPCRLRDIRELIMDTGIGVDGYSIIGQGKIADILSDKPEARREIFEEAAGIVKYKSKKDESEKKLETSKQNLDRVDDIIGEIESRIDGLKEDSIKAKEFIELKDRYKEVEINITLKNVENVSGKNKVIRDDIHKLHQSIEETLEQKKKIDKNIVEYEARNKKLEHTIASHQDKLMSLVNEINQLTNKGQLYREKLSVMDRDRGRIEGEISSFKMRKDDEIKEALKITEELRRVEEQHESFQADFNSKNEQVSRLEGIIDEMQNSIEEYKAEIYESHSLISGKRSEINSLLSLKETLEKRKVLITQEGKDHNDRRTELGSALQNITDERDRINSTNKSLTHDIENIKGIYNDSLEKEKVLAKELEEKKIAIGQVAARLKLIEEMESAYEGYNEAVKFIMKKNLAGMHGVVADLIRVPKGYEKAIETALGPSLQNIVCDSDVDAKEAIDLLKAKRVGRLTFLPITSIRGFVSPHKERFDKESGYKGLGVDCIKFEGRYEKVMEYLLGRVVIVDKLEDAIRMSRLKGIGGLRFVSLDGDVVNASGAITGGAYRNKTAGLLGRKAEAKALSDKLKEFQKDQRDQTENFEKIREIINSSKESIDELNGKLKKAEMDLLMNENQLERLSAEISNIENLNARKEREIATIKSEEQSADAMVDALKETVKEAENLISQAELKVQSALEEKASKDKKLSEANEELTQIRLIAGKAANEKTNAEQAMKRVQDYIQGYDTEISQRENDLLHIENEKTNLSEENKKSHDALTEMEAEKLSTEVGLQSASKEKTQTAERLAEARGKKESYDKIIVGWQTDKHELELRLAKNETLVEGYKEKLWEDFEVSYLQAMDFQKKDFTMSSAIKESRSIRGRMKELGEVNIGSIKEYENVKERYDFLTAQRQDLLTAIDTLEQIIEDMDRNIRKNFRESFDQVMVNFTDAFTALFGGGTAELRMTDESKPLETGIDIIVQPPGKKLQNINLLSGGEKTLTAIALMFSILKTKPTPFCILDEVEAALDEANIDRFARYLRGFEQIQFTLVTHQKATMEYADVLYGVTMPEGGISKVISLKLGDEIELN